MTNKNYYVTLTMVYDALKNCATPTSIHCGYQDGSGKDYYDANVNTMTPATFYAFVDAVISEHYGKIRNILKDDLGINVDDCELVIEKKIY